MKINLSMNYIQSALPTNEVHYPLPPPPSPPRLSPGDHGAVGVDQHPGAVQRGAPLVLHVEEDGGFVIRPAAKRIGIPVFIVIVERVREARRQFFVV